MDISNINASNAHTTHESAKPPVDSSLLKAQNQEAPETNQSRETSRRQAFEVNITQEAQDLLAAQAAEPSRETPLSDNGSGQNQSTAQAARQIVNIVA